MAHAQGLRLNVSARMFAVQMFAPGWAPVFLSWHRSRDAAERRARKHRRAWAARPGERRFEVFEA